MKNKTEKLKCSWCGNRISCKTCGADLFPQETSPKECCGEYQVCSRCFRPFFPQETSPKECCEKCDATRLYDTSYWDLICTDKNCSCHTSSLKEHKTFTEDCYNHPKCMESLKECCGRLPNGEGWGHSGACPVPSLEWDWEKEFEKKFPPWIAMEKYVGLRPEILEFIHKVESNALARGREEGNKSCPPHNFIPYHFVGGWGGSVPPPNMKCTKCLSEQYF